MTTPNDRLHELIAKVEHYQNELAGAEREQLPFVALSCRREIGKLEGLIRRHCELTGLPVPDRIPKSSRAQESDTKLQDLLGKLFEYRLELETAEIRGDDIIARGARYLIRMQHGVIRNHCRAIGLPLPPDVPPKDS